MIIVSISSQLIDQSGVEMVLVGDSLGMVVQGHDSTIPVTIDQMVYHTQCVARSCKPSTLPIFPHAASFQPEF